MQFKKIAFFIISITILFSGCDSKKEIVKEKVQTKFVLSAIDSTKITIETKDDLIKVLKEKDKASDKLVLLNFWATWCAPCEAEIPHLISLQKDYKDTFEIISINMGQEDNTLQTNAIMNQFIQDYGINYTVTNSLENFKLANALGGIKSIPTMFMIDKTGKIIQKYVGIVPEEMMEVDIKNALGKI
ncbi:MAG: TlpA family protein disulfide reductase [Halarcobacter sp.]